MVVLIKTAVVVIVIFTESFQITNVYVLMDIMIFKIHVIHAILIALLAKLIPLIAWPVIVTKIGFCQIQLVNVVMDFMMQETQYVATVMLHA